ncbi:MAG TPA: D-Ala-D-Ala carboxypeptidase family metallohydrolase, partial [Terricaulis sp.]|nr:D-Ala-D-Ala carboxypeptidase family metallohydrolase [Terricaulis sp.]
AARQLERVRTLLRNAPIMINAAYSTPELGAALGRPPNSDHLQGHSVDFTAPAFGDAYAIAQAIAASPEIMAEVDQLIFENGRWVHISFAPQRRGQILTSHYRPETGRRLNFVEGIRRVDSNGQLIEAQQQAAP